MDILARIKEANRAIEPEESLIVRIAVLVAAMAAVIAMVNEDIAGAWVGYTALVGIPFGFWLSHRYRRHDLFLLKTFLAIGLMASIVDFFGGLGPIAGGNFIDVQAPLAELFLWVQVLHSLHVPAQRDLMFSVVASGVMFAIIGVLATSLAMAPFLIIWLVAAITAMVAGYRSRLEGGEVIGDAPAQRMARPIAMSLCGVAALALLAFLVLPAARTSRALSFPIGLAAAEEIGRPGGLSNPSLGDADPALRGPGTENRQGDGTELDTRASFGYFGFAEELDTGVRGRPDDTVVMRVRAPAPDFWRGQSFDTWDGRRWTFSDETTREVIGRNPIAVFPALGDAGFLGDEFVQTYYLETPGPNIVFGASRVSEVYFPADGLVQLVDGTLRSPVSLGRGAVYTVVSLRQPVTADTLRRADPVFHGVPTAIADRYLQLPDVPQRVVDLAQEITEDSPTAYDKIMAIQEWMGQNTTYTLDIPPLPDGVDATEHYLFMTRQGFCEQIGTSLVVMLRALGIPARLAVGYTPGERNPFTGMFEVRAYDAHSWAEVWFPGVGWQSFDPTASVPLAGDFDGFRAGAGLGEWLQPRLAKLKDRAVPLFPWAAAALVVTGAILFARVRIGDRRRRAGLSPYERIAERLEEVATQIDLQRHNGETLLEFGSRVSRLSNDVRFDQAARAAAEVGFSGDDRRSDEIAALVAQLGRDHRRNRLRALIP